MADENLLGAIFANVEDTIEKTIQLIKEVAKDTCDLLWHLMMGEATINILYGYLSV